MAAWAYAWEEVLGPLSVLGVMLSNMDAPDKDKRDVACMVDKASNVMVQVALDPFGGSHFADAEVEALKGACCEEVTALKVDWDADSSHMVVYNSSDVAKKPQAQRETRNLVGWTVTLEVIGRNTAEGNTGKVVRTKGCALDSGGRDKGND